MADDALSSESSHSEPRPAPSAGRILAIVLPVALVGLVAYWWSSTLESKARNELASNVVGKMFVSEPMPTKTELAFADADHDMVADSPTDPAKLIKPEELVFSYVATEDEPI